MAIAVLATYDTKSEEAGYLADRIRDLGHQCLSIDLGVSTVASRPVDYRTEDLLRVSGVDVDEFLRLSKQERLGLIQRAAIVILKDLVDHQGLGGAIAIGGGQGTWLGMGAFEALPLALPKIMVSTVGHDASRYLGLSNTIVIPSLTDMVGLNGVLRTLLADAARMIVSTDISRQAGSGQAPAVAISMFGVTTLGGKAASDMLASQGLDVIAFHANGRGGQTMENFAAQGLVEAILDWTTTELIDEVVGGIGSAGSRRLDPPAGWVPRLVVPGAVDVVNFGAPDSVPSKFAGRVFHAHTDQVTLMRSSVDENVDVAKLMAERVNRIADHAQIEVLIPTRGFSALDVEGGPFYDPNADEAFRTTLRSSLRASVPCAEVDLHINQREFARVAVERFDALLKQSVA